MPESPGRRRRHVPVRVVVIASLAAAGQLLGAGTAAAHARLDALDLPASPDVTALDERIGLRVSNKAATAEGDPIQVFSPEGARIDNADPVVDHDGGRISVSIRRGLHGPGTYTVQYHVVSADSHVVRGREQVVLRPASGYAAGAPVGVDAPAPAGRAPLHRSGGVAWPALVLAVGVLGLVVHRRRVALLALADRLTGRMPALDLDHLPTPPGSLTSTAAVPGEDPDLRSPAGPAWAVLSSSEPVSVPR